MRRLSLARSVLAALLGLTIALTGVAAVGVGALYDARQDYEDRLSDALGIQAAAARLLAAGVVEEATLRLGADAAARRPARAAHDDALRAARRLAAGDARSLALVAAARDDQRALRRDPGAPRGRLAGRAPLAELSRRQRDRIVEAREDADARSTRALIAIVLGGGLALLTTLGLVAALVAGVRRPLDALVQAAGRLAGGDTRVRVKEQDGPAELRTVAAAFNAMARDVEAATARVEAERRRLAITVRALGDGLVTTDGERRVVQVNPRGAVLLPEATPGAVLDGPVGLRAALAGEVELEREGRTLAVTAAALDDAGGHVWTLRDVTERARLERMKSDFVATASHELRSPLTSIKGFVELLEASRGLTPRQQEWIGIVHVSTDRLVDLVNDLLDVTRLEAGQVEIHRRPTDVRALAEEVAALMAPRVEAKRQRLLVEVPEGMDEALVDTGRIRQVLTNLLTNAHLYTQEGGHLRIAGAARGTTLELSVADTGRGMDPAQAAAIFDRFYRGDERDGPQGTGLGLSIVKSLVDLHRGTVRVDSTRGVGTTFTVALPGALLPARSTDLAPTPLPRDALVGKRILVADDEASVGRLITEILNAHGAVAHAVADGAAALAALRAERHDALTLDLRMPGTSGHEVLQALRADPELALTPVVVVSVVGDEAPSGVWSVAKPIEPGELLDALGAAMVARRVRVLAVGPPAGRAPLDAALDVPGIARDWAADAEEATVLCATHHYEVALLAADLPDLVGVAEAVDLRGRRLRRAVLLVADEPGPPVPSLRHAGLPVERIAVVDAGAAVLGLLQPVAPLPAG